MTKSQIVDFIRNRNIDWRFPDEYDLCERNLDCKQLAIKEIICWKGEKEVVQTFLNPFTCSYNPSLLLRIKEPELSLGWYVKKIEASNNIQNDIRYMLKTEGYCLIYYKAFNMRYSAFYKTHEVIHWSLVIDSTDHYITLLDSSGSPSFFEKQVGKIPWEIFIEEWNNSNNGGLAYIYKNGTTNTWDDIFLQLIYQSYQYMIQDGGLEDLASYIQEIENTSEEMIIKNIQTLEFDINYYRRLRELWKVASLRKAIPEKYIHYAWIEELFAACTHWSMVMGLLMKWKRQPIKHYKLKLIDYLWKTYKLETNFINELASLIGVK